MLFGEFSWRSFLNMERQSDMLLSVDGEFELVFGTSCSSPVVGALITLVNDARIAAGKGPVGESSVIPHTHTHVLTTTSQFLRFHQSFRKQCFPFPSSGCPLTPTWVYSQQIYSAEFASAFNDITHGGNQGCGA